MVWHKFVLSFLVLICFGMMYLFIFLSFTTAKLAKIQQEQADSSVNVALIE